MVSRIKIVRISARSFTSDGQSPPNLRRIKRCTIGCISGEVRVIRTDNKENLSVKSGDSQNPEGASAYRKAKVSLKIYPDTLELADSLFERDNCSSRSEFIEKAVRFYCGYILNKESAATEFIAPQLATITDGIVKGSEQRLARAIFKLAVEAGVQSHILAAINDFNETDLYHIRAQVTDEVRRINGIINFESAQRYQRS